MSPHLSFAAGSALRGCLNPPLSAVAKVTLEMFGHLQKPPCVGRSSARKRGGRRLWPFADERALARACERVGLFREVRPVTQVPPMHSKQGAAQPGGRPPGME